MKPDEMRRAAVLLRCYAVLIDNEEPRTLARLLREEAEAKGWRDIATAPRDGSPVLVFSAEYGTQEVCRWDERRRCWGRYAGYSFSPVTHWRPLPPPPQGGETP